MRAPLPLKAVEPRAKRATQEHRPRPSRRVRPEPVGRVRSTSTMATTAVTNTIPTRTKYGDGSDCCWKAYRWNVIAMSASTVTRPVAAKKTRWRSTDHDLMIAVVAVWDQLSR